MDTENALTNAKESPNEIFFEEEAASSRDIASF